MTRPVLPRGRPPRAVLLLLALAAAVFFVILDNAVGGDFPGNPDATTVLPQRMVVDYVRVVQ